MGRTLRAIEPLLEEYDGVEIAAAAMELLEQERTKPRATADAAASSPRDGMVRLFLSVGARDGLRASDVLASVGNEAGVAATEVGKIEIRDSHTIIEVAPGVAPVIVERLTGKTISGRRAIVRPDQDAGDRPSTGTRGAKRDEGARPAARSGFGGDRRPPRDGPPRGRPAGPGRDRPRPTRPRTAGDGA